MVRLRPDGFRERKPFVTLEETPLVRLQGPVERTCCGGACSECRGAFCQGCCNLGATQ